MPNVGEKGVAKIFASQPALDSDLCSVAWRHGVPVLRLPTSFLPQADGGMFTTSIQLPSGSTQQQHPESR